jgi:hypothetical protein
VEKNFWRFAYKRDTLALLAKGFLKDIINFKKEVSVRGEKEKIPKKSKQHFLFFLIYFVQK